MQKSKLNRFIEKYHLGGNVNSVVLTTNDNNLETRFMSGDKSLLGELKMKNWKFENSELGVYDTEQLTKLLSVLGEDITIDLSASNGKSVALKVKDDNAPPNPSAIALPASPLSLNSSKVERTPTSETKNLNFLLLIFQIHSVTILVFGLFFFKISCHWGLGSHKTPVHPQLFSKR